MKHSFSTNACRKFVKTGHQGIRVIVAGLDMDYKGIPFGPIPHLLSVAEYITKVHAICPHCGNLATHSYRLSKDEGQVVLGEKTNTNHGVEFVMKWAIFWILESMNR